jgi:hypothetical protein
MGASASLPLLDEQALCLLHDSVNGQPCTSSYAVQDLQLLLKRQTSVITKRSRELEALLALRNSTNFARWLPHAKHGWGDLHVHKDPRKLAGKATSFRNRCTEAVLTYFFSPPRCSRG